MTDRVPASRMLALLLSRITLVLHTTEAINNSEQLAVWSQTLRWSLVLRMGAFFGPQAAVAAQAAFGGVRLVAGTQIGFIMSAAHAVEQAEERGVTFEEIEDAVTTYAGKVNPSNNWDSVLRYYSSACEVRVNKECAWHLMSSRNR